MSHATSARERPAASAGQSSNAASELVERAASLRPLFARNAVQTEQDRRVVEENIQALDDAGLFHLLTPRRFGGHETNFRTFLEVTSTIGEGCGATAWVTSLINVCNWMAALLPAEVQEEIFGANPHARIAGVLGPTAQSRRVDGGLIVSGRWGYASGSLHADWVLVGVPVVNEAGDVVDQGVAFLPRQDVTIDDTWFVVGMRGTGSNTIVAQEVFVPDRRILSVPRALQGDYATEHQDEALYRSAFVPVLALILVGPLLGLGRAALQFVLEKASRRSIAYTTFEKQTDSVAFQLQVADAALKIDTAHLHAFRAAADIDNSAAAGGEYMDFLTRARVRADSGYIARILREAVDTLVNAHGTSSMAEVSPLQRIWRDLNVGSRHAILITEVNEELYGKALLGIRENITPLI